MASLKNVTINDTGFIEIPTGTVSDRPGSPDNGVIRYNTDYNIWEYYENGWFEYGTGRPATLGLNENSPAPDGNTIYSQSNGLASTGVYWIQGQGSNTPFKAFIKMDYGGGWINVNRQMGPYSDAITGTSLNSNGGDQVGEGGGSLEPINGPLVENRQAAAYGCGSRDYRSRVTLSSEFDNAFPHTQVRWKWQQEDIIQSGVCGFNRPDSSDNSINISGKGSQVSQCANNPNQYVQVNPRYYIAEFYADSDVREVFHAYTACGNGIMFTRLLEIFIR